MTCIINNYFDMGKTKKNLMPSKTDKTTAKRLKNESVFAT